MDAKKTADEIIGGRRLTREDDWQFLLDAPLEELTQGADRIRQALCGKEVDLCSIINGRSGKCSEDCKFCAQSGHHCTGISEYAFLPVEKIVEDAKYHQAKGVHRYSIVTAGRSLGKDFDKAVEAYRAIKENCQELSLCASHGLLSKEEFVALKEAGVERYHENIETSKRNFPNICTTHTFEDKVREIKMAKEAGLSVCSGGIIGMGETWEDRIDMAITLSELGIKSIPLNILRPIPGTPLEHQAALSEDEILRTIAIFRYINPTAMVRLAAGRNSMEHSGERAFRSGANAAITGDMLTTSGNRISEDQEMLAAMGFTL